MALTLQERNPASPPIPSSTQRGRQSFQEIVSLPPTSPDDFLRFFGASWAFCAVFLFYTHGLGMRDGDGDGDDVFWFKEEHEMIGSFFIGLFKDYARVNEKKEIKKIFREGFCTESLPGKILDRFQEKRPGILGTFQEEFFTQDFESK